jgi:hypothetical protein
MESTPLMLLFAKCLSPAIPNLPMKLLKDPPPSKWNKKTNSLIGEQSTANTNLSSCRPKIFAIFLPGKNATTLNKDAYKSPKPPIKSPYTLQDNLLKKRFKFT